MHMGYIGGSIFYISLRNTVYEKVLLVCFSVYSVDFDVRSK
jgi:hypothetical protein